ncbi:hypothetical protein TIFTF001_042024 [Ficus carica]|uniref:Uncharacterized protein n=1 Tax=Ficus carica TaxID=3494 RepID=A0AA87ZJ64_FICCA|nr:hypothetical protein TIFTF001_042024 [Ficus carica]
MGMGGLVVGIREEPLRRRRGWGHRFSWGRGSIAGVVGVGSSPVSGRAAPTTSQRLLLTPAAWVPDWLQAGG